GLDSAKNAITKQGYAILMEGYMDVLSAHQFGFKNTIACMGTALTPEQIQKIKRFTNKIYLAMDNDSAGQQAVEKSCELIKDHQLKAYIVRFNEKDPADVLRKAGKDAFQNALDNALSTLEFKLERAISKKDITRIDSISDIINDIIPILQLEKDLIIQRHYIRRIAEQLKTDEDLIMARLKNRQFKIKKTKYLTQISKKTGFDKLIERLIFLMATDLVEKQHILNHLTIDEFVKPEYIALGRILISSDLTNRALIDSVEDPKLQQYLTRIVIEGEGGKNQNQGVNCDDYLKAFTSIKTNKQIDELKERLKMLESKGDDQQIDQVLSELQELMQKS
ncbi:toprim domain-containing protein, partial [Thermoproteota archaeon]